MNIPFLKKEDNDEYVLAYTPGNSSITIAFIDNEAALRELWIHAKINLAMEMAQQKVEESSTLPSKFAKFSRVFDNTAAKRFPPERPWDHKINFKKDFVAQNCAIYPLAPKEEEALKEFINENLDKGYIVPSIFPQMSPFFFIRKKDGAL